MPTKQLSVLVPSIRPERLEILYNSIAKAFSGTFEMIVIGPYKPPKSVNAKFIYDQGSPIRCQQRGLVESCGKYITWASDDGIFFPDSLDIAYKFMEENNNCVVTGKYIEGMGLYGEMNHNAYYFLDYHKSIELPYIRNGILMLNVGLVPRETLIEVGGWDCQFEVCPMAYNDLAIRLQNKGVSFELQRQLMFICSHTPVHQGDHGPIHDAQILHDHPLFNSIYNKPDSASRVKIPLDNWKQCPEVWERRFSEDKSLRWTRLTQTYRSELDILEKLCRSVEGNIFIDVGCFVGGFTQIMAKVAKERSGKVYSIDLFKSSDETKDFWQEHRDYDVRKIFIENMAKIDVIDCIEIIEGCSYEVAEQFEDESVDLVYIDADHSYESVKKDIQAWLPKVKAGGIISGHDYNPNQGVKEAVDELFDNFKTEVNEDSTNSIWYHIKDKFQKI